MLPKNLLCRCQWHHQRAGSPAQGCHRVSLLGPRSLQGQHWCGQGGGQPRMAPRLWKCSS